MSVSIIAAIGKNNELGINNDLIWHFREDMKFFKETTLNSTVIMGRKTFDSLPKALPLRRNIVITRNSEFKADGVETASGVKDALEKAGDGEIFIIGGGNIYKQFLPLADKLYLTEIDAECKEAETYFPEFDKTLYNREKLTDYTVDGIHFSHILYTKK